MKKTNIVVWEADPAELKKMNGNRSVEAGRVEALKRSLAEGYVINPTIVNKNLEIVDGQGRAEALRQLGKKVLVIIDEGATIQDCIRMNSTQQDWQDQDYVKSFAQRPGYPDYTTMWDTACKYREIPFKVVLSVCSNNLSFVNTKKLRSGELVIGREDFDGVLEYMNRYTPYRKKVSSKYANLMKLLQWVYDDPKVDKEEMYQKFVKNYATLMDYKDDTTHVLEGLEKIYNTRRRGKVYFRALYDEAVKARSPQKGFIHRVAQ